MENASFTTTRKEVSEIFTVINKIDESSTTLSSLDIFWTFTLLIITILSFAGNLLVCITLIRRHYLLTPSNRLVLSLSISNSLYAVIVLPFAFISSITKKWLFGKVWCICVGCTNLTVVGCSMLTLLLISADRYFVIIHPLKYSSHMKGCRVAGLLIFCWTFSLSSALVPIFKADLNYKFSASSFTCLPLWKSSHGFSLFWVSSFIIVPYFCVVIFYCCIFGIAHKKHSSTRPKRTSSSHVSHKDLPLYNEIDKENVKHSTAVDKPAGSHQQGLSSISVMGESGVITSKCVKQKSILHSATNLPHQVSYADEEPDAIDATCPNNLPPDPNIGASVLENIVRSNPANPVSNILMSSQELMDPCDHNPHIVENTKPKIQKTCGFVTSQDSEARPSTSHSFRRYSFCGKQMGFSNFRYYRNMPKACGTILAIVGLLLFNFGPFAIVTILLTFNVNSTVPDWAISLSSILLYFSCFYYPLIYGIWNETLRKEMVTILRRKSRGPKTRRTRILSLSTHLKDLGMSARLTTAIMGESAAMASIVYPMQIDSRIVKRLKSINMRSRSRSEHPATTRLSKTRKHAATESDKIRSGGVSLPQKLTKMSLPTKTETSEAKTQPREREKPLSDPFRVESTDILGSELLQSALLYGLSDNLVVSNQTALDACVPQASANSSLPQTTTKLPPRQSPQKLASLTKSVKTSSEISLEGNSACKPNPDEPSTSSAGYLIPAETFKKLKSTLIHLEAGEPIKVRQWDKSQYVDFFSQTLAFDLLNDAK